MQGILGGLHIAHKGRLIAFEGIEGAGKSTAAQTTAAWLRARGIEVVLTREPGGVSLGEALRRLLLDHRGEGLDPLTEALLFAAARRQHVAEKIAPTLAAGNWVLVDRYVDSSLVYQGLVGGAGLSAVRAINDLAVGDCRPDVTVLLDLSPDMALRRMAADRKRTLSRFDRRSLEFHQAVREGYLRLAQEAPERFIVVDAAQPAAEVGAAVVDALGRRFALM
ncbi:MAG: dTMP kinase [Hydrogenibacillus sp.]|nr:dTMP kinase [Hydrogenibacillus sp.]